MTENERLKWLQRRGAQASEMGWSHTENPLLEPQHLPAASGLSLAEWEARHDAWHLGWTINEAEKARAQLESTLISQDQGMNGKLSKTIE